MASDIEIRIFFMLIGVILGFILTWTFVSHRFWSYSYYKQEYEEYYNKWFNLHKRACEAWWLLKKNKSQKAYEELDKFYGEYEI